MPAMVALRLRLQDAVELDALPAGEAQRAVGVLAGQLVHGQVLVRRQPAAGDLAADHEHVVLAQPLACGGPCGRRGLPAGSCRGT